MHNSNILCIDQSNRNEYQFSKSGHQSAPSTSGSSNPCLPDTLLSVARLKSRPYLESFTRQVQAVQGSP